MAWCRLGAVFRYFYLSLIFCSEVNLLRPTFYFKPVKVVSFFDLNPFLAVNLEVSFDDHTAAGDASDGARSTFSFPEELMTLLLVFCNSHFVVLSNDFQTGVGLNLVTSLSDDVMSLLLGVEVRSS